MGNQSYSSKDFRIQPILTYRVGLKITRSKLYNRYTKEENSIHANSIYIYMIHGYVVGAFICFWWFRWQRWRFRFLIAGAMACYSIFFGTLYFGISPNNNYEMVFLPLFFHGMGMIVLFIAFGLYVIEDLELKYLLSNAFFLITFRSVLAPVIASAYYNNTLYHLQ